MEISCWQDGNEGMVHGTGIVEGCVFHPYSEKDLLDPLAGSKLIASNTTQRDSVFATLPRAQEPIATMKRR